MLTIIETDIFQRYAKEIWTDAEREAFISWIAENPLAGDVIQGTGGLRKIRGHVQAWENVVAHA